MQTVMRLLPTGNVTVEQRDQLRHMCLITHTRAVHARLLNPYARRDACDPFITEQWIYPNWYLCIDTASTVYIDINILVHGCSDTGYNSGWERLGSLPAGHWSEVSPILPTICNTQRLDSALFKLDGMHPGFKMKPIKEVPISLPFSLMARQVLLF